MININNTDTLRRFSVVAKKIYFKINIGSSSVLVPVEKGAFNHSIKRLPNDDVDAEFDGTDVTVTVS